MVSEQPLGSPLGILRTQDIVTLELRRPERRNALTRDLVLALAKGLEQASADASVRVIVLRGSGGAFCAGADLSAIGAVSPEETPGRIDEFHRIILAIAQAPQPVIAAITGPAVGFGADLALACDLRVMTEDAYLQESFVDIGLMPDGGGTFWAPHYFGARAFEALALGQRLSARECHALLVTQEPVTQDELEREVLRLAELLAQKPPLALRRIKMALAAARSAALKQALSLEKAGQTELLKSADFREAVEAFLAKRKPHFTGR